MFQLLWCPVITTNITKFNIGIMKLKARKLFLRKYVVFLFNEIYNI